MTSIHNPFLGRDLQEKLARQTSEKITHKTWSLLKCFSVVVVIVAVCCFWFFRCFFPKRSTLNNELFAQNTWQFPKLWRLQPFGLKHAVFNCFRTESLYRAVASMEQDETIASSWFCLFLKKRLIEKIIPGKKMDLLRGNQLIQSGWIDRKSILMRLIPSVWAVSSGFSNDLRLQVAFVGWNCCSKNRTKSSRRTP